MNPIPLHDLLRTMVLLRRFEEKIVEVYGRQDMKTPVHLYIGQEAVAAGVCAHLRPEDYLFSTHRNHGHCLAKGADPEVLYSEFYGRAAGCCHGLGGSMHSAFPALGILGTSAIVGGGIPHGVGTALASKLCGDGRVSVVFFGDGASEEGVFHESLNFAQLKRLPVLFVCENNGYATASPLSNRQPSGDISRLAAAHGMPAQRLDGNDVEAVYRAAESAVDLLRRGEGPAFLEAVTYRWKGHVGPEEDWEKGARPRAELEEWKTRCPLERLVRRLEAEGLPRADYERLVAETDARLTAALERARAAAFPEPGLPERMLFRERDC